MKKRGAIPPVSAVTVPDYTLLPAARLALLWHDEFDQSRGTPPDPTRWKYDLGGQGWGNKEYQYYTNKPFNASCDGNSSLVITARQASVTAAKRLKCWYGPARYTSARLLTQEKFTFQYGVVEARMRLPAGPGLWPALWMLGNDFGTAGWPHCGEIDIMENIGREPGRVYGTIHGPGYCAAEGIGGYYDLPEGKAFADAFHCFAVAWQPESIHWYMDGNLFFQVNRTRIPEGAPWVYTHPCFLLLNVAVGGLWPGDPDDTTIFPQKLRVDYVRVFSLS